jgi:hypothetical protein
MHVYCTKLLLINELIKLQLSKSDEEQQEQYAFGSKNMHPSNTANQQIVA